MNKQDELTNPRSCLNKASPTEMLFVLLARDPAAAGTVRFWIKERIRLSLNQPYDLQLLEAERCAQRMDFHQAHTAKEVKPGGDL